MFLSGLMCMSKHFSHWNSVCQSHLFCVYQISLSRSSCKRMRHLLEQIFWVVMLTELLILVCLCFVMFGFDYLLCMCICFMYIIECNWQSHWLHRVCYKLLIYIFEYLVVSLSHLVWRLYCIVWLVIILTVLYKVLLYFVLHVKIQCNSVCLRSVLNLRFLCVSNCIIQVCYDTSLYVLNIYSIHTWIVFVC